MKVLVAQSCPSVCDLMDCSPPGPSVHGISRQEYWSGLPFPSPGDLPDPGVESGPPALQADSTAEPPGKHILCVKRCAVYLRWNVNTLFLFLNFILYWSTVTPW